MLSFLFRLVRFGLSLVIAALFTLAVLALRLRYEGDGRFQIQVKERLTLEDTLTFPESGIPIPAFPHAPRAAPAPRGPAEIARKDCEDSRVRLAKAVRMYQEASGKKMGRLDIFVLLNAGVIDQLPACPDGGAYQLKGEQPLRVACSAH